MKIDETDRQIIDILKENAKLSTRKIAKRLNIPITTIHNRIKRLEKGEVIKRYTVVLDYKKLGLPISAYIMIQTQYPHAGDLKKNQETMAEKIKKFQEIEEVANVTGAVDTLAKVRIASIDELNDFIIKKLRYIEVVDKTQTMIVLKAWEKH